MPVKQRRGGLCFFLFACLFVIQLEIGGRLECAGYYFKVDSMMHNRAARLEQSIVIMINKSGNGRQCLFALAKAACD